MRGTLTAESDWLPSRCRCRGRLDTHNANVHISNSEIDVLKEIGGKDGSSSRQVETV